MSKPVNKTTIGLFVVVALALIVAGIVFIGSGKLFRSNQKFVLHFDGSVKGLSVGSPVMFRGVKVGSVVDIRMRFVPQDKSVLIPVVVEFGEANVDAKGIEEFALLGRKKRQREVVEMMIRQGMRGRLEVQSIVTGQLMIALDILPDKPARLVGGFKDYPEIPTVPTTLQEIADRVGRIPFEEIFDKLRNMADGIDRIVNSPEMTGLVKSLAQSADDARVLVADVNREIKPLGAQIREATLEIAKLAKEMNNQMGPLGASVKKTSDEATVTLKKAQSAIDNINGMTGDDSALGYRLKKALGELELAARSLRVLTETLEHQPESIIFGKKQTRRN